jgi:hypothetical protein
MAGPVGLSDEEVFGKQPEKPVSGKELSDSEVFGSPSAGTSMPGQLGTLAGKAASKVRSTLAQKDPDVNYSGIPDTLAQASYALIQKPEDKTAYLQARYGKDNVTKDSYGRDVVIKDGKKIAFSSREPGSSNTYAQDIASHAGDVLPVGGMIAGGVAGAPAGPLGSISMAGAGGMGGEAWNQVIANIMGLPNTQTSGERAGDVLSTGAKGAAAEALGQGAMFLGRSAMGPYKPGSVFGPWKANRPLYEQQMGDLQVAQQELPGMRPKVGTFAPNAPLVQRLQSAGNRVFGDEAANINRPIIAGKAEELANQAGVGKVGPVDSESVSNTLSGSATQSLERANYNANIAQQDAALELRKAQAAIEQKIGEPASGKLAGQVNDSIQASRKAFGDKASELYAPVDAMVGKPIVPTQPLKDALRSIIETMPPTKGGQVSVLVPEKLQTFAKGINELPEYISFQQMQAARSKFSNASDVAALDAGLSERQAGILKNAADASFDAAASGPFAGSSETAQALRKADGFYKAGMKRFDDLSVQALVKDAGESGFIQPEKVARFIATPGQADKLSRIRKVVSPEAFQQVGAERWKQMVSDSEDLLTGQIDGKKLTKQLNDMGGTLDVLYGQSRANEMRQYARQWAQLGGKADAITEPGFLKNAVQAQEAANNLQKQTWMVNIGKNGPESLRAADYLTEPNNRMAFNQARKTFGETSPEIASTKEYLARKIFSTMEQQATKGAEKYGKTELMGQPLLNELNRYGRPYLEDVFGRQWTDSAYNFAKAAEIATRKNPSDAGAIVVAAYALKPFSHIGGLIKMFGAQEILSSPAVISYMTRGIEGGAADFIKAMGTIGTRTGLAYEAVNAPRNSTDYINAAKTKMQNQLQQPQVQPQGMQGVRG